MNVGPSYRDLVRKLLWGVVAILFVGIVLGGMLAKVASCAAFRGWPK